MELVPKIRLVLWLADRMFRLFFYRFSSALTNNTEFHGYYNSRVHIFLLLASDCVNFDAFLRMF